MNDCRIEMVGHIGTALAPFLPVWSEHEVIDDELASATKQIRQGLFTVRAVKNVICFYLFPRQIAAGMGEFVPQFVEFFLLGEKCSTRFYTLIMI